MTERRLHPLVELTRARLLEFWRDPSALFWVFVFPVLLAVGLGLAFRNQAPEAARVGLVGPGAAELAARLGGASEPTGLELSVLEEPAAREALRAGRLELVARVEAGWAAGGDGPALGYRFDPGRPGAELARLRLDQAAQRAAGRRDAILTADERVEEPGGRYIDFLVPGLIGMNIMGSCMWGLGYALVDARRRRLLRRFAVTPMRRSHFLLSFGLSRLLFLVLEVASLVLFGWLLFGVRLHGSVLALAVVSLLGTAAFTGLALLIASRTDSTEAASGWMNLVQLPMYLLGGAFFDYSRFPEVFHPFIRALPLTALNDASRAVMNDGAGPGQVGPGLLVLGLWAGLSFSLALRLFRWQ
jgi:ABC-2 type transport system permease protein